MSAYTLAAGYPPPGAARVSLLTAVRIARQYRGHIPTVAQLQADFGMHRSTAWRWRQALCECGAALAASPPTSQGSTR